MTWHDVSMFVCVWVSAVDYKCVCVYLQMCQGKSSGDIACSILRCVKKNFPNSHHMINRSRL